MKNPLIPVAAATCAVMALAVPDWKTSLQAGPGPYANPVYTIADASVSQQVTASGCKAVKTTTTATVTLYDDGGYIIDRADWAVPVQGSWQRVPGKKGASTVYLSIDRASLSDMMGALESTALAECPGIDILDPTMLTKKNLVALKAPDSGDNAAAKGTLQMKGLQTNTAKGTPKTGSVSVKVTLTGALTPVL